mgnify:CR=1 FL=1
MGLRLFFAVRPKRRFRRRMTVIPPVAALRFSRNGTRGTKTPRKIRTGKRMEIPASRILSGSRPRHARGAATLCPSSREADRARVVGTVRSPESSPSRRSAAPRPISSSGWLTIVSGGRAIRARSRLSKPMRESSPGNPHAALVEGDQRAERHFVVAEPKRAVMSGTSRRSRAA